MNKYQEAFIDLCVIWDEDGKGKTNLRDEYPEIYNTLMELVDKETPKKVKGYKTILGNDVAGCPHCKGYTMLSCDANNKDYTCYCTHCGGKIDWSEEDA